MKPRVLIYRGFGRKHGEVKVISTKDKEVTTMGKWTAEAKRELVSKMTEVRKMRGVSQQAIGILLGYSKSAAYHWESGKLPSNKTCDRMQSWITDGHAHVKTRTNKDLKAHRMFNPTALTKKREKLGITQAELASALNVGPSAVSCWESGKTIPNKKSLKGLRRFFKERMNNGHYGLTLHSTSRIPAKRGHRSIPVTKKVKTSHISKDALMDALLSQMSKDQGIEAYKSLIK